METADRPLVVYWVNQFAVTPDQAGGTRHYDMSVELVRQGATMTVVASDLSLSTRTYHRRRGPRDLRALHETVNEVRFTWLNAGSYQANDWRRLVSMVIFGTTAFFHLLRVPTRGRAVFIGSSPQLFAALGTWAAARLRRVPFILEIRDLWPESFDALSEGGGGMVSRVFRFIADFLYRHSDRIVVLAEANAPRIVARGIPADRIVTIPNGVSLPEARRVGHAADEPVRFVYAGAHGPANGLGLVLEASALLREQGVDGIEVILVGDGPTKRELQADAARRGLVSVTFRDPVPKSEIHRILASMDVGLMILEDVALFSDGVSPNKLYDYLAVDLPVLTNVPGTVGDLVLDADAGVVCPAGNATALAEAMQAMAEIVRTQPDRFTSGRGYVARHFDRNVLAQELQELLQEVSP